MHRSGTAFCQILAACVLLASTAATAAGQPDGPASDPAAWADRLTGAAIDNDDLRQAFGLGQLVAELQPPEAALDTMRLAWPRVENEYFKMQFIKAWHFDLPAPFSTRFHPHTFAFFDLVLKANEPEVSEWVHAYLPTYTWQEMTNEQAAEWVGDAVGRDPRIVFVESMTRWTRAHRAALDANDQEALERLTHALSKIRHPFRRNEALAIAAEEMGTADHFESLATDHDADPKIRRSAAMQIRAIRPHARTEAEWDALDEQIRTGEKAERERRREAARARAERDAAERAASLQAASRTVGDDDRKRWLLHPPLAMQDESHTPPDAGYALLLVLPGGAGSIDFAPFVAETIRREAGPDAAVAQLVAPPLSETPNDDIVWPTERLPDDRVGFTIEPFALAVIDAVRTELPIDPDRVYAMGWSSGGPPTYTLALTDGSPVRGAFVIMSVFKPETSPPLTGAAGKAFYILHSPDDFIPMRFPEAARDSLEAAGGRTALHTYQGGHGWRGDSVSHIRRAIEWLDAESRQSRGLGGDD